MKMFLKVQFLDSFSLIILLFIQLVLVLLFTTGQYSILLQNAGEKVLKS